MGQLRQAALVAQQEPDDAELVAHLVRGDTELLADAGLRAAMMDDEMVPAHLLERGTVRHHLMRRERLRLVADVEERLDERLVLDGALLGALLEADLRDARLGEDPGLSLDIG